MNRIRLLNASVLASLVVAAFVLAGSPGRPVAAAEGLEAVKLAEVDRIRVVNKVKPAVVAVYARGGGGGGSGVVIDKEGYALTNFHVVQPTGPTMVCGLPNGVLYDAVLVGLDKVGDVALIKLIPKKAGDTFPFVELGNSDDVKAGEWSLAMGNPFLLATDFTPSVSYGLISGVNRYQYPSGGFLEYTDCIQFDTTINPGNSGGPLFNMNGELIGINGRGSFAQDKRFRINCGVGYAISINQIKNFLGHLRAGIDTDHATLGASIASANEDGDLAKMIVQGVLDESDAHRRGVEEGDQLISFAARPLSSVNQYKNILGIFPRDWRMPLVYARGNERKETLVRLMGYQPALEEKKMVKQPEPAQPIQPKKGPQGEGAKFYVARKGFANYYFNQQAQKRVVQGFAKYGDFQAVAGDWSIEGTYEREGRTGDMKIRIVDEKIVGNEKDTRPVVTGNLNIDYRVEPLKSGADEKDLMLPPYSGGLLMAAYHYRRFLTLGEKGFEDKSFVHGGVEPIYVQPLTGPETKSFKDIRVNCDVIRTEHAGVAGKWYFYRSELNPQLKESKYKEYELIAFEIFVAHDQDPCEVYLHDSKEIGGRLLPTKLEIRNGDKRYAILSVKEWKLGDTAK